MPGLGRRRTRCRAGGLRPSLWLRPSHYEAVDPVRPRVSGRNTSSAGWRTARCGDAAARLGRPHSQHRGQRSRPHTGLSGPPARKRRRAERRRRERGKRMQISAAVVQEVGAPFTLTEVELQEPAPDEVVVEIAGAGICHTDIAVQHGHLPFPLPGVLGHEGSGTVVSVGADVTTVAVGDQVAISFNSCGACPQCAKGQPAYCHSFLEYNFGGVRPDGSSGLASAGTKLGANFFGQSSLATHALAHRAQRGQAPAGRPGRARRARLAAASRPGPAQCSTHSTSSPGRP